MVPTETHQQVRERERERELVNLVMYYDLIIWASNILLLLFAANVMNVIEIN